MGATDATILLSKPGLGPSMAEFSYEHFIVIIIMNVT